MSALTDRADHRCELCGATHALAPWPVPPGDDDDHAVLVCGDCRGQLDGSAAANPAHWNCLREAAWSAVPAVQVLSWRTLHGLEAGWAAELLGQLWLDDDTRAWAEAGLPDEAAPAVRDSNGTALAEGDAVTLIKDLGVAGAGFTAKRGTMVKNIRLTDDPELVEGRVNGTAIYLKTAFLKKAR